MFSSKPDAKINIQPYQNVFHLHPSTKYARLEPDELTNASPDADETFWGNVVLSLPEPRELTSLVVKLNANYSVAVPGHSTETGILNTWECKISIPPSLDKGEHSFAWSLKIPRSSAPYERCPFGTVQYKLLAVAESPAGRGAPIKNEFLLKVVVGTAGGESGMLNERIEDYNDDVGPHCMTLASQHLTVGGVLHFSLSLASVPAPLRIHSISADIIQSYTLLSHAKPGRTSVPPPHRRLVFHLDARTDGATGKCPPTVLRTTAAASKKPGGAFMAVLGAGDALQVSHIARLPDDNFLRASTHAGTRAPIRVRHTIVLEVLFSKPDTPGALQVLRAERPLTVLSCGCLPEDLAVPSYDSFEEARRAQKLRDGIGRTRCANYAHCVCTCMYTLDALLQTHHAPLLSAHEAATRPGLCAEDVFVASKWSP